MTQHRASRFFFLIPLAAVACLAVRANAQLLTFEFQGTLTEVVSDPYGLADAWGSVGDPFWGYLSYDLSYHDPTSGFVMGDTEFYGYREFSDPAGATITLSLSTPSQQQLIPGASGLAQAMVTDNPANDMFVLSGEYAHGFYLGLYLTDATGTAVSDTGLPANLDLSNWASSHYVNITGFPDGGYVRGDITFIQVVPEPRTETLIAMGIGVWSLRRRVCCSGR